MKRHHIHAILFRAAVSSALAGWIGLAGCRAEPPAAGVTGAKPMTIELTSTALANGQPIPKKYTGEGEDVSPPLAWSDLPEGTKELALICEDPDAPTEEPWVHWVVYKIPATIKGLKEGISPKPRLTQPAGMLQGQNSWKIGQTIGYRGPMPPPGHGPHRYYFTLYALSVHLVVEPGLSKQVLLKEIENHVLATGELMGTYQR